MRIEPGDARYGSGVPPALKPAGLAFIEMTGIPRRAWVRDLPQAEAPGQRPMPAPPASSTPGSAFASFQALLNEMTGQETVSASNEPVPRRPAAATRALSEAESLLLAMERPAAQEAAPGVSDDLARTIITGFEGPPGDAPAP